MSDPSERESDEDEGVAMSLSHRVREHVGEHRSGMVVDLAFAVGWVTVVSLVFDLLEGPQWAYYLCLAAGVVAYFVFFASLDAAEKTQD